MTSLTGITIPTSFNEKRGFMESLGTLVKTAFGMTHDESQKHELADSFSKGASNEILAELSRPFLKQKLFCELCSNLPELDSLVQELKPNQKVLNNFLNTPVSDLGLSVRLSNTLAREASGFVREILFNKTGVGSSFENLKDLPPKQIESLINALVSTLKKLHLESLTN